MGHLKRKFEYFQLEHQRHEIVLCDNVGCEEVADYLALDEKGHEYRLCGSHTDNDNKPAHASQLPKRKPNPDLPYRSRSAV